MTIAIPDAKTNTPCCESDLRVRNKISAICRIRAKERIRFLREPSKQAKVTIPQIPRKLDAKFGLPRKVITAL
jgi:hypothetical protein